MKRDSVGSGDWERVTTNVGLEEMDLGQELRDLRFGESEFALKNKFLSFDVGDLNLSLAKVGVEQVDGAVGLTEEESELNLILLSVERRGSLRWSDLFLFVGGANVAGTFVGVLAPLEALFRNVEGAVVVEGVATHLANESRLSPSVG